MDLEKKRILRSAKANAIKSKKRMYYKKVVFDGVEFSAGDDVYVKRREDASSDEEDPEVEECRVCFKPSGRRIMIECDDCLNGFHLKCLRPPLKDVPEGDWICNFCTARKSGEMVKFPEPPKGKRLRTAREKLLSSDLWAAHIERSVNLLFTSHIHFAIYSRTICDYLECLVYGKKRMVLIGFAHGGILFQRRHLQGDSLII